MTKSIKIIVVLALFMGLNIGVKAQQVPLYSNYFFTPYIYNPSQSGLVQVNEATVLLRRQWADVEGAPQTGLLGFNGISNSNKVGYSVFAQSDQAGIMTRTSLQGNYAYHLQVGSNTFLDFGIGVGYMNHAINMSVVRASNEFDPALFGQINGKSIFDVNIGGTLRIDKLLLGAAVPQLFSTPVMFLDQPSADIMYASYRHFMINAQYDFEVSGDRAVLSPMLMLRSAQNVPTMLDIGAMLRLKTIGHVGLMLRPGYAFTTNIGVNITDQLTIGYAHDFSTSDFSAALGSTNELMLTWRFGSSGKLERLENEMKKMRQNQTKKDENTEKIVEKKVEELKDQLRREMEADRAKRDAEAEKTSTQTPTQTGGSRQTTGSQDSSTPQGGGTGVPGTDISSNEMASNVEPGSKGYYVVAGVFSQVGNAEALQTKLRNQGFDARYFQDPGNKMFYVYLFKFGSYNKANQVRTSRINGKYNDELWIKIVD